MSKRQHQSPVYTWPVEHEPRRLIPSLHKSLPVYSGEQQPSRKANGSRHGHHLR